MTKVIVTQDNDCHWYVIPAELYPKFNSLLDMEDEGEDEFIREFSEYMTGGDINNIQLYAKISTKEG